MGHHLAEACFCTDSVSLVLQILESFLRGALILFHTRLFFMVPIKFLTQLWTAGFQVFVELICDATMTCMTHSAEGPRTKRA